MMKVDPDGILASLIKSPILVNPFSSIENQLVKKVAYMQSRVEKLQQYNEMANAGAELSPTQNEARTKLDEVLKHQKYIKHLTDIIRGDRQQFEKSVKAADILLTHKLDSFRSATISETNVYGEIITRLLHPSTKEAFLSGTNGAVKITSDEVDALSRLKEAFCPSFSHCASLNDFEKIAADAATIVSHIFSEAPYVVDTETGLSGKEIFALLNSIKNCDFFSGGCDALVNGTSGSGTEAPSTDSPSAISSDLVDDNTNEESLCPLVSECNNTEETKSADHTDLEVSKSMVNSVVSEDVVSKQVVSSSSSKSDEKVNDENLSTANESDLTNGGAAQSPDMQSVAVKEMNDDMQSVAVKEMNDDMQSVAVKEMNEQSHETKKRGPISYYNSERRYNPRQFTQPWDPRNRDRIYRRRDYHNAPENGEQWANGRANSVDLNLDSGDNQKNQHDRRFYKNQGEPSHNDGKPVSREQLPPKDRKENDNRAYNSRQNVVRANTRVSAPYYYQPGFSRRPAPTTIGFIFADR
ncbi:hypothetical protein KIN20_008245 [Parelaphostrongylus tenuis]|uniref:Caprin-1 dimerization domain-containing protein n=1 Tax=Parelaphostrongylus tenuis TaxID=148309 RepID=A0AAD5MMK1_PARTN|nr:hypothetical protein KIN20_008245 [Parelaphostrongylus tenuis]